jgi:peroxiredoxin-like protein
MTEKPATERKYKSHVFRTSARRTGERTWEMSGQADQAIPGGPPRQFGGDGAGWSPEELLLASVSSCHLSTFLAYSRRKGLEFVSYESEIEGLLEHTGKTFAFTKITVRPKVVVKSPEDVETARQYLHRAEELCYMSNSVKAEVVVEPEVIVEQGG